MADENATRLLEPVTLPRRYSPPSEREVRAQSVHRLQVGLFGLCTMLLIVALANVIMDRAREGDQVDPIEGVIAADSEPQKEASDPLADIGVVPAADPAPEASASFDATDRAIDPLDVDTVKTP